MIAEFNNAQKRLRRILELVYIDENVLQFKIIHMNETYQVDPDGEVSQVLAGGVLEQNASSQWVDSILMGYVRDKDGNMYPRERAAEVEAYLNGSAP